MTQTEPQVAGEVRTVAGANLTIRKTSLLSGGYARGIIMEHEERR